MADQKNEPIIAKLQAALQACSVDEAARRAKLPRVPGAVDWVFGNAKAITSMRTTQEGAAAAIRRSCDQRAFSGAELSIAELKRDHAVDSVALAEKLDAQAQKNNATVTEMYDSVMSLKNRLDTFVCANVYLQDELAFDQGKAARKDSDMVRARKACFERARKGGQE